MVINLMLNHLELLSDIKAVILLFRTMKGINFISKSLCLVFILLAILLNVSMFTEYVMS